ITQTGVSIYLNIPLQELALRTINKTHRPLLEGASVEDRLAALLKEREAIYKKASFEIQACRRHFSKCSTHCIFRTQILL
ncbi:MAG: hypothetical protein HC859_17280, partial [Bacteroidia bacterium]|nr:hypothetical protein [Bacteroidia bacterium]